MPGGGFHTPCFGFNDCEFCFCHPLSEVGYCHEMAGSSIPCIGNIDNIGSCNCECGNMGNLGEAGAILAVIGLIFVLIIAFIGFIFGVIFFIIFVITIVQKRLHYLKKKTKINTDMIVDRSLKV